MLVVMTGLPCTGKSVIAAAIGRSLPAAVISADPIDAALVRAGIALEQRPHIVGYEIMKALTSEQLSLGLSVVIDAVNPFEFVRDAYADIAISNASPLAVVATVCSDSSVHRHRVEDRHVQGLKDIDWIGVERQIGYYEPPSDVIILDAMDPIEQNIATALAYVRSRLTTER